MRVSRASMLALLAAAMAACAPAAPEGRSAGPMGSTDRAAQQGEQSATLIMIIRDEPGALTPKLRVGITLADAKRLFNAGLTISDERQQPHPDLAEALPRLNTDSWRVFPDGRMETTYVLRPNLTWHDGTPLSADDFVFASRVYANPGELPLVTLTPQNQMEEVLALDQRTVLIRWRRAYPEAGTLAEDFPPLPRHLLEQSYLHDRPDVFASSPYWTQEYIGLGPYRLERWEPGSFIDGVAFGGHSLGRPRIERIRLLFIPDPNTVIANLLSGAAHMLLDHSQFRLQQGTILEREWASSNGGTALLDPTGVRKVQIQFRPETVNPRAILDLRVRKALAHTINRQGLIDATLEGKGFVLEALVSRQAEYFADAERAVAKYPYDLRRADQLMNDAGFTRGADGFYVSTSSAPPAEGRFSMEVRASAGTQNEQDLAIMVDGWQRAGVAATPNPFPVARLRDGQYRTSFPALQLNMAGADEGIFRSQLGTGSIPRPENRWTGSNRGGWVSPDFDQLLDSFESTLDRGERDQHVIAMAKLISEQLPVFTLYYDFNVKAFVAALEGPRMGGGSWNVHQWRWR